MAATNKVAFCLVIWLLACTSTQTPEPEPELKRADLLNPQNCQVCHADQFQDWAASMHAYASDDPVFQAMNARGQRETQGKLGTFCLNCHAPQAVKDGIVQGNEDLSKLAPAYRGITCYYCHAVESVTDTHNNPLQLATDLVMRGPIADPLHNTAHRSGYSPLHDRDQLASATLCGSCHDLQTTLGAHLERGFEEWQKSVFNQAPGGNTCGQCHMPQSTVQKPVAQYPGAPIRRVHSHLFPGVDVALTPFPDHELQRTETQQFLDTALATAVCVQKVGTGARLSVILDNLRGGHNFPSGASQDRRVWVELIAKKAGKVIFTSGEFDDHALLDFQTDPDLWLLRDCTFDPNGKRVHMFWDVAQVVANALPAQQTFNPTDPRFYQSHVRAQYPANGQNLQQFPDEVTMRVRMQPVAREVLEDLVLSGDMSATVMEAVETLQVGKTLTWTQDSATHTFVQDGLPVSCRTDTALDPRADTVPATRNNACEK